MTYRLIGFNTRKGKIEYALLHNIQAKDENQLHTFVKRLKPKYKYDTLGVVDMGGKLVFKV
jgi:hypothetical protein